MTTCGIYGFDLTLPFEAAGLAFRPLYTHPEEINKLARDKQAHRLTGTVSGAALDDETEFRLEAVLSFIERLDVRLSEPSDAAAAADDPRAEFAEVQRLGQRHNGGGAVINPDRFGAHREARRNFIELAMRRLADTELSERTKFRTLLFKSVETFRQRRPILEVTYFLLVSGLEAFSRKAQNDFGNNAAKPVFRTLRAYGFGVYLDNKKDLHRSISTYFKIRNAIFHNGELTASVRLEHGNVTVKSSDFLYHLQMLVCLTVMKALDFEDPYRNWDSWIDRQVYGNFGRFSFEDALRLGAPPA